MADTEAKAGPAVVATLTDRVRGLHPSRRKLPWERWASARQVPVHARATRLNAEHLIQAHARTERVRYDGFRAFLLGRPPSRRLADAFARQIVARGEQGRYGYPPEAPERAIAQDFYYWVCEA